MVENRQFLEWVAAEKFDIAFSNVVSLCPIGIIHYTKIPAWIWLDSTALVDYVAYYMGVPLIPSYTPRKFSADKETKIFREVVDPNFPDLVELAKKCPLVSESPVVRV
ncbi:unnamed protein product [Strongylus vulgaris]|uniref:Uncharacterized protein n=1 Tax=Strongylus vulgaris TaxID=40348 RepID=A0A3P7JES6_STRVU|nr:unnamed protein product [Strongylus vulgaris]